MTKKDTLALPIGAVVYCTVRVVQGWYRVMAVRPRDGYIKLDNWHNVWCQPGNFALERPAHLTPPGAVRESPWGVK